MAISIHRRTAVRVAIILLLELTAFLPAGAATQSIQDVKLIGGTKEEVAAALLPHITKGWSYIDKDLNDGCGSGSDYIYLLYKKDIHGDEFSDGGITGFYIYSWNGSGKTPPDTQTIGGRKYYLVPCEGGDDFVEGKGDLNEGAGLNSDFIYLYYTRDPFPDSRVVTGISFNTTQSGALGTNGGTTGYDLNNNAGGDYIYMHVATATKLEPVQIGDGQSGTPTIPFYLQNAAYPYSLSQQIYTAEEIGKAGTIKAISFYHRPAVTTLSLKGIQILMKHTEKDSFDGLELDPVAGFTTVFEGDVTFSGGGWVTIHLDSPFNYDGNSNLMICCYESSSTHSSGNTFTYHYADNKLRRTASKSAIDINTTLSGSNTTMRNDIRLNLIPNPYGNPAALALTNASDNSAAFSWNPPKGTHSTITGYAWQYKKAEDENWSVLTTTTSTTTTASVSGLSPYTEYLFRVKTLYGSNESSYSILRFLTAVNLPYFMGFENGMPGWSQVDYNHFYNIDYTGISDMARHDGAYGYLFEYYDENPVPQYLISPGLPGDEISVSFYYRNYAASGHETFQLGYSTTTTNISDFTWGDEICDQSTEWRRYERAFPAGTRYIAVKYLSNLYRLFLDDFELVAYSSYAKPTDLRVDELGEQIVKLKWTAPDGATGYACQYKAVDGGEWSAETSVSSTSFTLNGLSANTTYDFRVKAFHGSNGTHASNFETIRFVTEGPMESLPHFQDFESGMGGWRLENGHGRSGITTREQHGGAYGFEFDNDSPQAQYLRSPLLEGNSTKILSFYFKPFAEQSGETTYHVVTSSFRVGWSTKTNKLTDFEEEASATPADDYKWNRYTVQLPEETKYAFIKVDKKMFWLYIDDISIADVTLPEAVEATVMGETKYVTTFYDGTRSWQLPKGTVAYQVAEDLVLYRIGAESHIIPAGMAVVIVSDKTAADTDTYKTINMTLTSTTDLHYYHVNILRGSDSAVAVNNGKIDGKTVYVLGIVDGALNFYPFEGSEIPAGKAYFLGD